MKLLFVIDAFTRGLAIPPHVSILDEYGRPCDLRPSTRGANAFWSYFRFCLFNRREAEAAIERIARHDQAQRRELEFQLASIKGRRHGLPETVDEHFRRLEQDFARVTMAICDDNACERMPMTHAHAYQHGLALPEATFGSTDEARVWINENTTVVDGANAHALRMRLRDWPGMPLTATSSSDAALERQTA